MFLSEGRRTARTLKVAERMIYESHAGTFPSRSVCSEICRSVRGRGSIQPHQNRDRLDTHVDEIRTLHGHVQTPGDELELLSSPSFSYFHILFYDVKKNVKTPTMELRTFTGLKTGGC